MNTIRAKACDLPEAIRLAFRRRSPRNAADWAVSTAVLGPEGRVVAQHDDLPVLSTILAGAALPAVRAFGSGTSGEVFITNDPYGGGMALDTIAILAPILEGGETAALAGAAVRVSDIGAMREDAFTFGREIIHEGVRLAGLRMKPENGGLPPMLSSYLAANIRGADDVIASLNLLIELVSGASLEERLGEGADEAAPAGMEALVASLAAARGGNALDASGFALKVGMKAVDRRVGVSIDRLPFDEGGFNVPLEATRAGVLTALGEATGLRAAALARHVFLDVPPMSRFNAGYPAAVTGAAWGAFLVYRAVSDALGNNPRLDLEAFAGHVRAMPEPLAAA